MLFFVYNLKRCIFAYVMKWKALQQKRHFINPIREALSTILPNEWGFTFLTLFIMKKFYCSLKSIDFLSIEKIKLDKTYEDFILIGTKTDESESAIFLSKEESLKLANTILNIYK